MKLIKWFRVTFLGECPNCNRTLKTKRYDNWFVHKCKCGHSSFGHTLTDREL